MGKESLIIDGKSLSQKLMALVAQEAKTFTARLGYAPGVAVVRIGEDPASKIYVQMKRSACKAIGIKSWEHALPENVRLDEVKALLGRLGADPQVNGILVQLPLPPHLDPHDVIAHIPPAKDVDGLNITNVGLLTIGREALVPCTPLGCLLLLLKYYETLEGSNVVVIGRSNLVGRPLSQLLLQKNATVTITHSRSRNLPEICRKADILIAAAGVPHLVKGDWVKKGAVVLDVGIHRRIDDTGNIALRGDVDFKSAQQHARAITPVPGGVGPMTVACLLYNTVLAATQQEGEKLQRLPTSPLKDDWQCLFSA